MMTNTTKATPTNGPKLSDAELVLLASAGQHDDHVIAVPDGMKTVTRHRSVRQRRVDVIVVDKVDRLTRSLADFAKLVELFDANGVYFVLVTQAFNTTTSMGWLTLNVLLSFAQSEREVTGKRIRDKIAASKRRGQWVGGNVPLGYGAESKKLVLVDEEADQVRLIFRCARGWP